MPISSLQVSVSVNAGARLHATIPPLPQGLLLTRGMKVALFKKVNNDKAYLRFHGLLITKNYSKTFGERHLSIDCASPDCRWATMVCSEMNKNSFTCTVVNSAIRVNTKADTITDAQKKYDSAKAALQNATKENNEKHTEETEKNLTEATDAAHAAQVALSNAKLGTVNSGAINAGVSQYMASSTRLDGYVKPVVLFPDTKNLSWDMSREFLQKNQKSYTTIYGVFQRALAGIDASGAITKTEGEPNPLSAFKEVLATAYEASDDYTKREYDQMHMYNQMYTMPVFRTDQFRIYATEDTKYDNQGNLKNTSSSSPSAQQTTEYNFGQAILKMAEDMIGQQHAAFPLYSLISKMMDMFFCKVSVDPLKVDRSICFHPEMISCIPPKCNVIFPNMYNGISLNFNAWTEPTRSVISYPPALEKASVLMNTDVGVLDNPEKALASSTSYIADTTDPYLAKATDLLYNQGEEYDKTKDAKTGFSKAVDKAFDNAKKAFGILTEEETMCGVVPNVAQIPFYPLSFASKEIQASLANFVHSMAKFSNRSCTVNCCLIDDMAVGMPVLLVDDVFSIHGILENYTYSVTPDGQIGCQASIAYPKMIFNGMDTIPQPPVWINSDNISVENIGSKVYSGLFGCNSMYDDEEVTFDNVNEITYKMAKIAAAAINRYNKAADKLLFVNDYRMRASNISMEDYFKNILNCEPEFQAWDATAVKVWKAKSGEDSIFAVYNGGNGRASIGEAGDTVDGAVTLQHTAVDKQQMVLNYVNAIYRGTVSGIIGGMLVDNERADDLIVTVRDDIPDVQQSTTGAVSSEVKTTISQYFGLPTSSKYDDKSGRAWESRSLDDLHPRLKPLAEKFIKLCQENNIKVCIYMTYRSNLRQDQFYAMGRYGNTGPIRTYAKGGQSDHNYTIDGKPASLAFDAGPVGSDGNIKWNDEATFKRMAQIAKSIGLKWGGDFKKFQDTVHFYLKL